VVWFELAMLILGFAGGWAVLGRGSALAAMARSRAHAGHGRDGVCATGVWDRLGGLACKVTCRGQGESPLAVCVSLSPRRLLCFPIGDAGEGEWEVGDDGGSN
jgi:hypothetical protein